MVSYTSVNIWAHVKEMNELMALVSKRNCKQELYSRIIPLINSLISGSSFLLDITNLDPMILVSE